MIRGIVVALASMGAVVLSASAPLAAQHRTLSDVVACNEHAAATIAPSALPDRARAQPTARPGAHHDPPETRHEKTDPSGGVITASPDPFVVGMDAGHAGDRDYRAAYRRCMEERTGPRR